MDTSVGTTIAITNKMIKIDEKIFLIFLLFGLNITAPLYFPNDLCFDV